MNQYLLAAIEFGFIGASLFILYFKLGLEGLFGLFLAFVGFELHLIWHRKDREAKAARKNEEDK